MQGFQYQVDKDPIINIPIAVCDDTSLFEMLIDYLIFLNLNINEKANNFVSNEHIIQSFDDVINACVYELYFADHMKENGIDVLQFVNEKLETIKEKSIEEQIKDFYLWYQKPENPVRQRMLLVETRSKDKIALINKSIRQ